MLHSEKLTVCALIGIVFSTLLSVSSSETIYCTKPYVELIRKKPAHISGLEISVSFERNDIKRMISAGSNFMEFEIENPSIYVNGSLEAKELGDKVLDFDSLWLDNTSQYKNAIISGRVACQGDSQLWEGIKTYNASLVHADDQSKEFDVNTERLSKENKEDGKRLVKLQKTLKEEIRECLSSEKLRDIVLPETGQCSADTNSFEEITGEPPREKVEKVDIDRAIESIIAQLNHRENFENWDNANVSVPGFGNKLVCCKNGSLRDVEDLRVHGKVKQKESNGGIKVRVPLTLPTTSTIYDCQYNSLLKNQHASRVVANAEKLKFELDLFVEKKGGECKSTVTNLITSSPGKVKDVNDYNSGEPVTEPLQRLMYRTWGTEVMFAVEDQIYKVAEQRLRKIEC